jgi:hypothetical protein
MGAENGQNSYRQDSDTQIILSEDRQVWGYLSPYLSPKRNKKPAFIAEMRFISAPEGSLTPNLLIYTQPYLILFLLLCHICIDITRLI